MATITRLPSGKHRAQVRREGVYRSRTLDRKADALAWAATIEVAISSGSNKGTITPPKAMTLGHIIDAYLGDVRTGRTTAANLRRISRMMGEKQVIRLNAVDLSQFIAKRRKDGVSGVTLAGDLSALSCVLRWARHVKQIDINDRLAREARSGLTAARITTRGRERTRLPTQAEFEAVVGYLEQNPRQIIPVGEIARFAIVSGMRLSEIVGLQITDVRWNERSVLVRARKDPQNKDTNDQVVPLVGNAYTLAQKAAASRSDGRLWPYSAQSVSTAWRRACKAAQVHDLHFHDLRHAALTELFRTGLPIELVAVVSGHKDWKHLKRYTQLGAHDVHAAIARLENVR